MNILAEALSPKPDAATVARCWGYSDQSRRGMSLAAMAGLMASVKEIIEKDSLGLLSNIADYSELEAVFNSEP